MRRLGGILLVATTLVAATFTVAPAHADGPHSDPVTVTTTVEPGAAQLITSQSLPKDSNAIKVTLKPPNLDAEEMDVYDAFLTSIGTLSKQGRLLVCTMMYQYIATLPSPYSEVPVDINVAHVDYAGTVLLACLHMAGLLANRAVDRAPHQDRSAPVPARAAAVTNCEQARPSLPATMAETDDGWSLTASGETKKAKRPKLKVSCKEKGQRLTYKIRPATKGVPLRKVVGKQLKFGILSPSDASTSVPVKVTFDPL